MFRHAASVYSVSCAHANNMMQRFSREFLILQICFVVVVCVGHMCCMHLVVKLHVSRRTFNFFGAINGNVLHIQKFSPHHIFQFYYEVG